MTTDASFKKLLADTLSVPYDQIAPDSALIDDLGADSLDIVELVMAAEEEFQIEITDDEADKVWAGTVADWVELIDSKRGV